MFLRIWNWYWAEISVKARKLVSQNGIKIQEMTGVSIKQQYRDMIKLALFLPCRPEHYYIFDFFDYENRKLARDYVFRHEMKNVLYKMLLDVPDLGDVSPLTDKGKFAEKAGEAGLPIESPVCIIANNRVGYCKDPPKKDLFVKALDGKGGRGAKVWYYDSKKGGYKSRKKKGQTIYKFSELVELLKEQSNEKPVIVQARLKNHLEISDLCCNALSTCRVFTVLNEKDEPEVAAAVFRMAAQKGKVVDNFHKGGIAAPVCVKSGTLGRATNLGINAGIGRLSHHPVTGALIEGRKLFGWEEITKLAVHAHNCFRPRVIVGWDIAMTENGPVIIEGNAQPCVDVIQRPYNKPLSQTRFGELVAFHLRRKYNVS